jgi:hypothetical protein
MMTLPKSPVLEPDSGSVDAVVVRQFLTFDNPMALDRTFDMSIQNELLPDLEEPCRACGGTGNSSPAQPGKMRASIHCEVCKGYKVAPTKAGQQLIEFISRRFRISEYEVQRNMFG